MAMVRQGKRREQLLDDLSEKKGYCKIVEALVRTLWRTRFGRGYGPVVRQTTESLNAVCLLISKRVSSAKNSS